MRWAGFLVSAEVNAAPTMPSGHQAYHVNQQGETYGSAANASPSNLPDLIEVTDNQGQIGYITRADFLGPSPSLSQVLSMPTDNSGNLVAPPRTVLVYNSAGTTQVGTFTIGSMSATSGTSLTSSATP